MSKGTTWHRRTIEAGWDDLGNSIKDPSFSAQDGLSEGTGVITQGPERTQDKRNTVHDLEGEEEKDEVEGGEEGEGEDGVGVCFQVEDGHLECPLIVG